MARYGPAMMERGESRVDAEELLAFIDRIEVCTTCGWSRQLHTVVDPAERVANICAHWRRDL